MRNFIENVIFWKNKNTSQQLAQVDDPILTLCFLKSNEKLAHDMGVYAHLFESI